MNIISKTFQSTNFTLQSIIPLVTAVLLLIGVPEDMSGDIINFIIATVTTGVGFWGFLRDIFKGGISFNWSSNVLTYIVAFFSGLFPFLAGYDIAPAVEDLIAGISSGDFSRIFAALFVVGNIIYQIIQGRNQPDQDTDTDSDSDDGNVPDGGKA